MADKYVKKTGNDSSGDGSSGNPYLTITKAVSVLNNNDRVIIGAGTYEENNIGSAITKTGIKICDLGDGMVIISGSDGTADGSTGNVIRPYNTWTIDGSTGSNVQNIEIIGGSHACVSAKSTTKSFSVKHCILTGRGDRRDSLTANVTQFGIHDAGGDVATIRNCVMRNFKNSFQTARSNGGATKLYNNICYNAGHTGSSYSGFWNNYAAGTEFFFNTITDFTGTNAIYSIGNGSEVKNNLIAFVSVTNAGILADGSDGDGGDNFTNNNVYIKSGEETPEEGSYEDYQSTAIHSSNKELDPVFYLSNKDTNPQNPWREQFGDPESSASVDSDFSLKPTVYHYPGSSRSVTGTELAEAGTDLSAVGLTTDFSGSTRSSTPTIGALEVSTEYLFETAPTADVEDKVKADFTLNHYNRISAENPRNVDQLPFSKLFRGPSNLRDRTTAYKLTKEGK